MAGKSDGWRSTLGVACSAGVVLILIACGEGAIPRADAPTADLAAKNLTATAYRPTADRVTPAPTPSGTSSTVWITHGGPIVDHVSFVDKLRGARCTVDPVGSVRQPFLRAQGIVLRASGCGLIRPAEIQSFAYHTDDLGTDGLRAAEEDAREIGPDGQPVAIPVAWTVPPHFFRKERALVLYRGDDPALLALLADLLGPQFAGRTE